MDRGLESGGEALAARQSYSCGEFRGLTEGVIARCRFIKRVRRCDRRLSKVGFADERSGFRFDGGVDLAGKLGQLASFLGSRRGYEPCVIRLVQPIATVLRVRSQFEYEANNDNSDDWRPTVSRSSGRIAAADRAAWCVAGTARRGL
jgi:hypothetical protein